MIGGGYWRWFSCTSAETSNEPSRAICAATGRFIAWPFLLRKLVKMFGGSGLAALERHGVDFLAAFEPSALGTVLPMEVPGARFGLSGAAFEWVSPSDSVWVVDIPTGEELRDIGSAMASSMAKKGGGEEERDQSGAAGLVTAAEVEALAPRGRRVKIGSTRC